MHIEKSMEYKRSPAVVVFFCPNAAPFVLAFPAAYLTALVRLSRASAVPAPYALPQPSLNLTQDLQKLITHITLTNVSAGL